VAELEAEVLERLDGDEDAQLVLLGRIEEQTPDEICAQLSLSRTSYETICKRIRRKLVGLAHRGSCHEPGK
jgi:DNA-directed RNA polymerase specialized sigma24 family protein